MNYEKTKEGIKVFSKEQFNTQHILECGQVFSYSKSQNGYFVFPSDKFAEIVEEKDFYFIRTANIDFFEEYFDLKTDYNIIKNRLRKFDIMENSLEFGYGIRILKQNIFETVISFIISANNNIKRIQLILNKLRSALGNKTPNGYAFPSYQNLLRQDEKFFKDIGAGYRSSYIYKVLRETCPEELDSFKTLPTELLRKKLLSFHGIGPKVADCILLFGYGRGDVFPVDTWIYQMYNMFYVKEDNRNIIREKLVKNFGQLSGYAQQYLFYFQRSQLKIHS